MAKISILCCLFLFLGPRILIVAEEGSIEICSTPNQEIGNCIVIDDCVLILNVIKNTTLTKATRNYLKSFHCGFQGLRPKVCCPSDLETNTDFLDWIPESHEINSLPPSNSVLDLERCGYFYQDFLPYSTHVTSYPWLALLRYNTPNGPIFGCGGTLITKQHVLTAAHCAVDQTLPNSWKLEEVRLGEYNIDTKTDCIELFKQTECSDRPIDVSVERVVAHSKYNSGSATQEHNIALLKLSTAVEFTDYVSPICLPSATTLPNDVSPNTLLLVAGWGASKYHLHNSQKNDSTIVLKPNSECEERLGVKLSNDQLCTTIKEDDDACCIDSGGPLMTIYPENSFQSNFFIVGVMSGGRTNCYDEDTASVYTNVKNYITWIKNNLQ